MPKNNKYNGLNVIDLVADNLRFVGDIHGDYESILYYIDGHNVTNTIFVICGDCGIGFNSDSFYTKLFKKMNRMLSKGNNYVIMLRGNHDNPV